MSEALNGNCNPAIPDFADLRVTTMTLVLNLDDEINYKSAFEVLPITTLTNSNTNTSKMLKKCKIPHCNIPGSILSLGCDNKYRGIVKKKKKKPFKNACTIILSTNAKNISTKLSPKTIQMCGASSVDDGIEAGTFLVEHLNNVQKIIKTLNDSSEHDIIGWVKKITKGESNQKTTYDNIIRNNCSLQIVKQENDHNIRDITSTTIPSEYDKDVVHFLLSFINEYSSYNELCQKMDRLTAITSLFKTKDVISFTSNTSVMVNYNYALGFKVDRFKLHELINAHNKYGFMSRYNNSITNPVTIELPYVPHPDFPKKRRNNKIPHHSFSIYRSGSVTQSGPNIEMMRSVYYTFRQTIESLRPHIEYKQSDLEMKIPKNRTYMRKNTDVSSITNANIISSYLNASHSKNNNSCSSTEINQLHCQSILNGNNDMTIDDTYSNTIIMTTI